MMFSLIARARASVKYDGSASRSWVNRSCEVILLLLFLPLRSNPINFNCFCIFLLVPCALFYFIVLRTQVASCTDINKMNQRRKAKEIQRQQQPQRKQKKHCRNEWMSMSMIIALTFANENVCIVVVVVGVTVCLHQPHMFHIAEYIYLSIPFHSFFAAFDFLKKVIAARAAVCAVRCVCVLVFCV